MKKKLLMLIMCGMLFSCSKTPQEVLFQKVDEYIETEYMKTVFDPKSFEKIEIVILDTLTLRDSLTKELDYIDKEIPYLKDNAFLEYSGTELVPSYAGDEGVKQIIKKHLKTELIRQEKYRKQLNTNYDEIIKIKLLYKFRATNSFGALVVSEEYIDYYPNINKFIVITPQKK